MAIELTEKLLIDAGGWQAAKHARALAESGRVISAAYDPPVLKGVVQEGGGEYRAGLKIKSKSDMENLCTCRPSREYGTICAHSLALGYHLLKRSVPAGLSSKSPTSSAPPLETREAAALPKRGPWFHDEADPAAVGEPVKLFVVLPPQFAAGWERGNVTVGVEAQQGSRRILLNALPERGSFRCSAADLRLVEALRKFDDGKLAGMLALGCDEALTLLEALKGHPRVSFGRNVAVTVAAESAKLPLRVSTDREGRLHLRVEQPKEQRLLLGKAAAWSLHGERLRPVASGLPAPYLPLLSRDIVLPPEQVGGFVAGELPALRRYFEVEGGAGEVSAPEAPLLAPEPGTFSLSLEGSLNHLTARLQRIYRSGRIVTLGVTSPKEDWAVPHAETPGRLFSRHHEAEREAVARLTAYGFTGPDTTGHYVLRGERAILAFLGSGYPQLQKVWEVSLGSRITNVSATIERIEPRVEITSSGQEWFDLQFDLATASGQRFSTAEIQRLLNSGQNHVRLKNGKLAVFSSELLDDFSTVLRDCNPSQRQPGEYRIHQAHAGYLHATVGNAGFELKAPARWQEWARLQQGQQELQPLDFGSLNATLREYQRYGASWLGFLASNGLGGILADDMGLGKTVQALAFLRNRPGPSLVVCPSSLVFNWKREAERFTPERKLLVLEGSQRSRHFSGIAEADLVITSYPLLRRDADKYQDIIFNTIILDEAQHIKNPDTQNAQAATRLRAERRFILTGTPVENSVRDIWSLMHFVMPGYLGDRDDFRERYEIPITRHSSGEAMTRLSRRLRPFLLRRRKQEVARDLPAKLEQVAYCELTQKQRDTYAALLQGARTQVEAAQGEKNSGRARMLMLTALLRLRQAACDLRLLKADEKRATASGKVELLGELLSEAIDGGHRVLVFSQFVSMLSLLRQELDAEGIGYCYLDGSTKDRAAEVDRFQNGAAPVFLISLKAGGTGLNLTAADTVIHFDPWWNPAVEAQATDRAHRIGQEKVVTSYKLIARGTVEEKILALQRKKREMIDATIETEEPLMESLSMDEISSLLME